MHVADGAERVVGRQEDLPAVGECGLGVGRDQRGRVAHHSRLDLSLAGGDDARVEVDLGHEAEGLLEGLQEAHARLDVAHPVVRVRWQHRRVKLGRHRLEAGKRHLTLGAAGALDEAENGAGVGIADALLAEVVGEHVERAHAALVSVRSRHHQLGMERLVPIRHDVELARRQLEAEDCDALGAVMVLEVALHVGERKVVVRIRLRLLRRGACVAVRRRDDKSDSIRVGRREQQ